MIKEVLFPGENIISCLRNEQTGRCEIRDFLEDLKKKNSHEYKKILKRLESISKNYSLPKNPEKFKFEEDKIFAIKSFQVRLFGFMVGRELILTNGYIKQRSRADKVELQKSKDLREQYLGE